MNISKRQLMSEAGKTGFQPGMLEKVLRLLDLLEGFRSHPFLKTRLALKGGSALNLFVFNVPRLSVDIDLNYIGAADLATMKEERPKIEQAIQAVCEREGLSVRRIPREHAGGKWILNFASALGETGTLEIDANFMFRVPLWPVAQHDSRQVGSLEAKAVPVLDVHELCAGKLTALLARHASRDLFDADVLFRQGEMQLDKLRLGFVIYGAGNRRDWRQVTAQDVDFDSDEIRTQLIPLFRERQLKEIGDVDEWGANAVKRCRNALASLLPFSPEEMKFLNLLLDEGEIDPSPLTEDEELATRIRKQPLLKWKALKVRRNRGLDER